MLYVLIVRLLDVARVIGVRHGESGYQYLFERPFANEG